MANPVIVNSQTTLQAYSTSSSDTLFWPDPVRGGMFSYVLSIPNYTYAGGGDDGVVFKATGIGSGFWIRVYDGDILPGWFGIANNGSLIPPADINNWMKACARLNKAVHFPEGRFCLPMDFQANFGSTDIAITGVSGKTVVTTYNGSPSTNFAVPAKLDITRQKPNGAGEVYEVDITGPAIHSDFSAVTLNLGDYVQILDSGAPVPLTLKQIKALGYLTELDITGGDPSTPSAPDYLEYDGLYVVSKHINFSYGGSFAHLDLRYLNGTSSAGGTTNFDTGSATTPVYYVQGTILKRVNGVWSRYFSGTISGAAITSGGGFGTTGNLTVKDIIFDNVRFYLFSPFDLAVPGAGITSEIFSITNCTFRNCNRVISSMTYAGTAGDASWVRNVYTIDGRFRFRNFSITNNDFSYIHQSICWAAPPSQETLISGNHVHDCYTIIATFFLYMATPANTSTFWIEKISQSVTGNSFVRIRPLNPGANWNTSIIRTAGNAVVNDNIYLDITQQAIYFSSTNSTFNGNSVTKFLEKTIGADSTVMLVKTATDQGMIEISGNTINAAQCSLVAIEGLSSFNISGNNFIGNAKARYITNNTTEISPLRIYRVKNIDKFHELAVNYDTVDAPAKEDLVYYDKRKNIWVKMGSTLPVGYLFSKNYNTTVNADKQCVIIEGNRIEIETLTRLENANEGKKCHMVSLTNNEIFYSTFLHIGNKVIVEEYICEGNYFRDSSVIMGTILFPTFTNQVKTMYFQDNKIGKLAGAVYLFAYQDIIFSRNLFYIDQNFNNQNYYTDFERYDVLNNNYTLDILYGITLKGNYTSRIIVDNNHFISMHSRYGALLIDGPNKAEIKDNIFDLNTNGVTNTAYPFRNAVRIETSNTINVLSFTDNTIYPEPNKSNYILHFDDVLSTIASLTVDDNRVPQNVLSINNTIKSNIAPNTKIVSNYYRGTNFYGSSYTDVIINSAPVAPI